MINATTMLLKDSIQAAIHRIPPLWPLSSFVAVNPFLGFSNIDFSEAAALLKKINRTSFSMPPAFYRERYESGFITKDDLKEVLREGREERCSLDELVAALDADHWGVEQPSSWLYPSSFLDATYGTRWNAFIVEEISKWCASYFDQGQAFWTFPWKEMPLFVAWKQAASMDCNPEISGMKGWRKLVSGVSDDPLLVIREITLKMGINAQEASDIFHGLLTSVAGWAGYLQFLAHQKKLKTHFVGEDHNALQDLLAIRLVYEMALWNSLSQEEKAIPFSLPTLSDHDVKILSIGLSWQRAHEYALQKTLFVKFREQQDPSVVASKLIPEPLVQAVFCIDVRSEIYRRRLEQISPEIQTLGFAGFFGFPVESISAGETSGHAQCPVLIAPTERVFECHKKTAMASMKARQKIRSAWKAFKSSAVSSFIFVEVCGLGFLWKIGKDLFGCSHAASSSCCGSHVSVDQISLEKQVEMAAGALRHMGFHKRKFSRTVLFCAHGSSSKNNPYASSLDCGACGGHSGEVNAKTAATILNDCRVRAELSKKGISIPEETWFLAGLHNTTTDTVTLFEIEVAPRSHHEEIKSLLGRLNQATTLAQKERAPALGLAAEAPCLEKKIAKRGADWSQIRPEWGLAGNYAFVIAPRKRTRGMNFGGRVFLHDYHYEDDDGESTLELILTAPVVVASWINLQYFASTVDHQHFGSGDKTIHNVVSLLGVLEGNGGDIKTGLPFQSVHDGKSWRHEPIRLHVCIEAPREAIDRVLKKHLSVADLVRNHWIYLFSVSNDFKIVEQSDGRGGWKILI
ncbi:MAG: YbcC family protein [Chthoniobacterales bacterium]